MAIRDMHFKYTYHTGVIQSNLFVYACPLIILILLHGSGSLAQQKPISAGDGSEQPANALATFKPAPLPRSGHRFIVIAHRGDHVTAPENSLAALDSAIAHEADYVEMDLRTSSDGVMYVLHDESLQRTSTGNGRLKFLPSTILDTCHLKNSSENIPRFETFLERSGGRINIYLDFKDADVAKTLALIEKYGLKKHILVYINAYEQYVQWRKTAPEIPLIISLPDDIRSADKMAEFLQEYPAEVLDGGYDGYNADMLVKAGELNINVWPDIQGMGEQDYWDKALNMGFKGLQSDHPGELVKWLIKKGVR
jgi:glycerophosphoryl diester phosphodiesterase